MSDDGFAATTGTLVHVGRRILDIFLYSTTMLLLFTSTGPELPLKQRILVYLVAQLLQTKFNDDIFCMCNYW